MLHNVLTHLSKLVGLEEKPINITEWRMRIYDDWDIVTLLTTYEAVLELTEKSKSKDINDDIKNLYHIHIKDLLLDAKMSITEKRIRREIEHKFPRRKVSTYKKKFSKILYGKKRGAKKGPKRRLASNLNDQRKVLISIEEALNSLGNGKLGKVYKFLKSLEAQKRLERYAASFGADAHIQNVSEFLLRQMGKHFVGNLDPRKHTTNLDLINRAIEAIRSDLATDDVSRLNEKINEFNKYRIEKYIRGKGRKVPQLVGMDKDIDDVFTLIEVDLKERITNVSNVLSGFLTETKPDSKDNVDTISADLITVLRRANKTVAEFGKIKKQIDRLAKINGTSRIV
ncbi:MAG: hypothetical protein Kow0081_0030 [Candidatus Dojkabacteria bacterium]